MEIWLFGCVLTLYCEGMGSNLCEPNFNFLFAK